MNEQNDPLNPNHYILHDVVVSNHADGRATVECQDILAALDPNFFVGAAIKYLFRVGKKDGNSTLQDLNKARHRVDRAIVQAEDELYEVQVEEKECGNCIYGMVNPRHYPCESCTDRSEWLQKKT